MRKSILLLFSMLLLSCSSSLQDHQIMSPSFDLRQYFDGKITARGIIQDYSGKLTRQFCVDIDASWQSNRGTLHETFYFADGERQIRIWHLQRHPDGLVTGSADDVVGTASGRAKGNAFNWQYVLRVPIDETDYDFFIDDWMYLLDEHHLMNRSYMQKLGITVAEISIVFTKHPVGIACQQRPVEQLTT
ncbi:DUF3833 domain-containing protein [Bowmanella pacifica]|uniref:Lipoprotein n=1 Tax=Bowmanella pacifica TaxID=502051 RepID=A0A918DGJ9_9ALTE|nr:DUF3833 domain-containing protein [Bowmanella pacifica]GGO63349.1 lipoprotein [Bowmanella pacifica]